MSSRPHQRSAFATSSHRPHLLFGRMYEDWRVEARAFSGRSRIFCIASAGCTAIALAHRGHRVTAVDVNPAQIDYVRSRLAGGPILPGQADRVIAAVQRVLPLLGLTRTRLRHFLSMANVHEQMFYWERHLRTRRLLLAARAILGPRALRIAYAPRFLRAVPGGFGPLMLRRLERAWAIHPNHSNPYSWRMLLNLDPPETPADEPPITDNFALEDLCCADAAEFLESTSARFDAFTFSNILDGAGASYRRRLLSALNRSATPDARVVLRSFAEPAQPLPHNNPSVDRSGIWGIVWSGLVDQLAEVLPSCTD